MKKEILFFILILSPLSICFALNSSDSTIIIKLQRTSDTRNLGTFEYVPRLSKSDTLFYKYNKKMYKKIAIQHFNLQPDQSLFEDYKRNSISYDEFYQSYNFFKFDSTKLSKTPINQSIDFFSGIIDNKKVIICDLNHNKDFTDDEVFEYDLNTRSKKIKFDSLQTLSSDFEYFYENRKILNTITFKILPFDDESYKFSDLDKRDLNIFVIIYHHQVGTFTLNEKNYKIAITNPFFPVSKYNVNSRIYIGEKEFYKFTPTLKLTEPFKLEDDYFQIKYVSLFGDTVKLQKVDLQKIKVSDYRVGEIVGNINAINLRGGNPVLINKINGNKLIYFWGTWCKPCMEKMDSTKNLYKELGQKINFISVAYDTDFKSVEKVVSKRNLEWMNLFVSKNNPDSLNIIETLHIDCFPTYIILNQNNKILFRNCGNTISELRKEILKLN